MRIDQSAPIASGAFMTLHEQLKQNFCFSNLLLFCLFLISYSWVWVFFFALLGQTSAGKSVLINLLLGEDILPWGHLQVTSTICEIRYGEHPKIVAHSKRGPTTETFLKRPSEETNKSYHDQISPFVVHGKESPYEKVELFWPHPLLQVLTIFQLQFRLALTEHETIH